MTAIQPPTDLQDERLRPAGAGARGQLKSLVDKLRGGDLGFLPVIVGLVIIWSVFQALNPTFLSSRNLSNLLMQSVAVGVLALGIVFVLLLGEIDLSVGSVSGLAAAIMAVYSVNNGWPLWAAIGAAIAVGVLIGFFYAAIYNIVGVPSFVITLAGLLGFLGLQLFVLGPSGTINLPFDSPIVVFGQLAFVPQPIAYVLAVATAAALAITQIARSRGRAKAGLSAPSLTGILIGAAVLAAVLVFVVFYLYDGARGIGWMVVLFVALVLIANYALTRTSWGRSVFAVGGNREAARRAGINVVRVYTSVFVIASTLAVVGGILAAGRLAAASQSSGAGDTNLNAIAAAVIGGTSLFGGRGSAFAALLGIIVIQSITSGLTLLNMDPSIRYMVTGAVVLIAVSLDALARRSRRAHGRG
ncbi:sugar ABC transporter permease [Microbacterium sp. P01]|uniref:sugar ABC transporter permease n=1 Tax=unclassified Microbacterium TaxID=2609290 RepID=UPI00366EA159